MPAENELNYHEEEEYANQDATNIIDYEEINEHIQPKEEEYVDSDTELQQQECAMYQEEEYVDSESPEYIEMEQIDNDEDRILFAIAAESDVDQIEGECIIVKTEENVSKDGVRKKRKYEKTFIKDRPYKCWQSGCSAAFTHRSSINKHMLLAHNIKCDKNTCMMCGTKFAQYAEFLSHVKTHTRKSECDICKLTFVTDEKMQAHRDRVHKNDSNERNFKCHLCDAMFKRKEHLNSHITYRHTDQSNARRFPCNECSSTFLTRQDLNNHQKSHSQLKKTCTFCDYECRDLKSIKLHYLKVHGTTEIYRCTCEASFELFKDYQLHKKNCYGMINQE
ncbi:hypothetical protein PVAND_013550 [Polypedilum vanderplanki]|uniref:C2H2-type domain-containing protein n=1 Tax=Polypedilum vanderplanki TaxID=319348 RepID=A0A9J6CRX6_POLVA|nr:hypothetical protein PVAND_013550 [Polypedilum vanderplanki]